MRLKKGLEEWGVWICEAVLARDLWEDVVEYLRIEKPQQIIP